MSKFIYMNFGENVPREVEKEYNRLLRQEQYQQERDIAHGVGTPEYDPLLHNIADRTLTSEFQAEVEAKQHWHNRLVMHSIALDWLRMEFPDEYKLIQDYYYVDESITLMCLADRYGITKQALGKRIAAVRDKLRNFIITHENKC